MNAEWYCRIMSDEWGPMSADELIAVARWGRLTRDDVVRKGPDGEWVRAENVEGLFEPIISESAAAPKRVARAPHQPTPARRSMHDAPASQYWVCTGKSVEGPFFSADLRKLAEQGRLKPDHLVSRDRMYWVCAARVKGLVFGGAGSRETTVFDQVAEVRAKEVRPTTTRERRIQSRYRAIELTKSVACG
jgi:hypothetical protein